MLKKIALVMLLALPMGVFAQNLKFGHINAQEIITVKLCIRARYTTL